MKNLIKSARKYDNDASVTPCDRTFSSSYAIDIPDELLDIPAVAAFDDAFRAAAVLDFKVRVRTATGIEPTDAQIKMIDFLGENGHREDRDEAIAFGLSCCLYKD